MCYIIVDIDDIMSIGWLYQHKRKYWFIFDNVYKPSMSIKDNIWSITSYFHTSIIVNPGSNYYLWIRDLIHRNILFFYWRNNGMKKNHWTMASSALIRRWQKMLMKHLYITIQYLSSKIIYKPFKTMNSDYFTQTI